jgi:hypothetical protein
LNRLIPISPIKSCDGNHARMPTADEVLQLEVSILDALLARNLYNHGRTFYYKRMKMVQACIRRYNLLSFANRMQQVMNFDLDHDTKLVEHHQNEIDYLSNTLSTFIPELVSRIGYAARALFTEISRGFFLPFSTVAASALARIRYLVLQTGYESVMDIHKIGITFPHRIVTFYDESIKEDTDEKQGIENTERLCHLAESIGIAWTGEEHARLETISKLGNKKDICRISKNINKGCFDEAIQGLDDTGSSTVDDIGIRFQSSDRNVSVVVPVDHVDYNMKIIMHKKDGKSKEKGKKRKIGNSELVKSQSSSKREKKKNDFLDELFKR